MLVPPLIVEGETREACLCILCRPHALRPLVSTTDTLSKHIVQRCVDEGVGTILVGVLSGIREDAENDNSKNWGKHGNLDLHSWASTGSPTSSTTKPRWKV